jgi:ParB/Sulfiredoxin domain
MQPERTSEASETDAYLADGVPTQVPIALLRPGPFLRRQGLDEAHARRLAEISDLPPITIEAESYSVLDGAHRVRAAILRGESEIQALLVYTSGRASLEIAIRANARHGKPLTLGDRERAAEQLLEIEPQLSDRVIAETCGLSPTTIGKLRRATVQIGQSEVRRGRDGRIRHVSQRAAGNSDAVRSNEASNGDPVRFGNDCAFTADWRLMEFAQWLDSAAPPVDLDELPIDLVPLNRIYVLADEARRRSAVWLRIASMVEQRPSRTSH